MKRAAALLLSCVASVAACGPPRQAERSDPRMSDPPQGIQVCDGYSNDGRAVLRRHRVCELALREVRAFGDVPRGAPPEGKCPMGVRAYGDRVSAEAMNAGATIDPLPWPTCVPPEYLAGGRHVLHVDDGFLVAYESVFASELSWYSEDGLEKRFLSAARFAGLAKMPSGAVMGLGIGAARLGKGGIVRFEHTGRGRWEPKLVTVLPLAPSAVMGADDDGLIGFAQGFLFHVDEAGKLENVHYVAHDLGRVASIAKTRDGSFFLGLECGVLRIDPRAHAESWWSARDGASGRWPEC